MDAELSQVLMEMKATRTTCTIKKTKKMYKNKYIQLSQQCKNYFEGKWNS